MKTKQYTHKNVTFGFQPKYRAWAFMVQNADGTKHEHIERECRGFEMAEKVAAQVSSSFDRAVKRDKAMHGTDGMAFHHIDKIVGRKD